ncbi:nitrate reductase molybdenum cofactor assembly chaperone [Zhengella mangrovi]|uniref:Nitrate reductase molybdenum cofactor assembly chaperone n=1 Tax=Zhengella mangrovi TaxID=1982044 RepID=A0A2G1QQG9_9HYPH|nr:nitrate reductase molybdenum cofactor assembly chaperone [Zhengella mangrovi]PHP67700.1 nitrate reductase molybdenum cofactor assembly chaperone [Zhengella mangrovi]
MNETLKILSILLSYPDEAMAGAMREIRQAVAGLGGISQAQKGLIEMLASDIAGLDLFDAQERYVYLFDRTRTLSLHLFEHVHGESRDRGQAMVDLLAMYEADGLEIDAREMPDYLPVFLEYLSVKPQAEAAELLGQVAHIVVALGERLKKRGSVYANAFAVLEELAAGKPDAALVGELVGAPEHDPADLEALDRVWEEEAVTFGGNAGEGSCGPDRLQRQMRAHTRKPDAAAPANPL